MKITIYEYHDSRKGTIYKDHFSSDYNTNSCFEIETEIPDYLNPYICSTGNLCIEPDESFPQMLDDCLCHNHEIPTIKWVKNNGMAFYCTLPVYSRTEKSTAMYL